MNFTVEFSKAKSFDYGDFYFSKIVSNTADNILGIARKKTYYIWGVKELTGTLTLNIDEWNVTSKPFEVDGKQLMLDYIVGPK